MASFYEGDPEDDDMVAVGQSMKASETTSQPIMQSGSSSGHKSSKSSKPKTKSRYHVIKTYIFFISVLCNLYIEILFAAESSQKQDDKLKVVTELTSIYISNKTCLKQLMNVNCHRLLF